MTAASNGNDPDSGNRKHPCADCVCCQWCGDDRCRLCRGRQASCRKLTQAEQIELYESLNRGG